VSIPKIHQQKCGGGKWLADQESEEILLSVEMIGNSMYWYEVGNGLEKRPSASTVEDS
jgi:hypothetical protein